MWFIEKLLVFKETRKSEICLFYGDSTDNTIFLLEEEYCLLLFPYFIVYLHMYVCVLNKSLYYVFADVALK